MTFLDVSAIVFLAVLTYVVAELIDIADKGLAHPWVVAND